MKLHTYGLLRNSFRPPEEIRAVRTIWRLRDRLVQEAGRTIQQIQKALTTMNIRLANAIKDVSGVTGMAIIRAMLKGERDPRVLAKLRDALLWLKFHPPMPPAFVSQVYLYSYKVLPESGTIPPISLAIPWSAPRPQSAPPSRATQHVVPEQV